MRLSTRTAILKPDLTATMNLDQSTFQTIRQIVLDESAIALADGKEYLVESRLRPVLKSEGFGSMQDLALALKDRPRSLTTKVVEALTTNETSFFRDVHPFDALRDEVLPELLERNAELRSINLWSAASSSGQEPISLAVTLLEHFPECAAWDVKILATDINEIMLERCRLGRYSDLEVSRGLPPSLRDKYFRRDGAHWQVSEEVLDMIEYKQLNLAGAFPSMPPMDVIFMRNVLIYFEPEAKARILARAYSQLRPDCVLFLGTAENVAGLHDDFRPCPFRKATAFRTAA